MKFRVFCLSLLFGLGFCSQVNADSAVDMLAAMDHPELMHFVGILVEIQNANFEMVFDALMQSPLGDPDMVLTELADVKQSDIDGLQMQIDSAQSTVDSMQSDIDELQIEYTQLESQLDVLLSGTC